MCKLELFGLHLWHFLFFIILFIRYIHSYIYIYTYNILYSIWGEILAETQDLPSSFDQRLLQGRKIYRFISICELCLQLENFMRYKWLFKQFLLPMKKVCMPSFQQKMIVNSQSNIWIGYIYIYIYILCIFFYFFFVFLFSFLNLGIWILVPNACYHCKI